jgi:glycosyltransferase involved in cell wall biosynthesis
MLKVLQVIPNRGWAIDKLMTLIGSDDVAIKRHYIKESQMIQMEDADVIDFGLWCNVPPEKSLKPFVLTMHHIEKGHEEKVKVAIDASQPTIIISSSRAVQKDLKKIGIDSEFIPLAVPQQEFRVGYIGMDIPVKRFDIIEEACKKANVKCWGLKRNIPVTQLTDKELNEWYRLINVLVVAATEEPSSMPGLEAQAAGTKVISTKIGMKPHKAIWFDGSVDDLVKKINKLKPKPLITPAEYSRKYIEAYKRAYDLFYNRGSRVHWFAHR